MFVPETLGPRTGLDQKEAELQLSFQTNGSWDDEAVECQEQVIS